MPSMPATEDINEYTNSFPAKYYSMGIPLPLIPFCKFICKLSPS
jgi:hypothetical protein